MEKRCRKVKSSALKQVPKSPVDRRMSARHFVADQAGMHFYTGLESYDKFHFVLRMLGPAAQSLNYYNGVTPGLDVEDQFFVTLTKMRRAKPHFELSQDFGVSEACISSIFITWVNFMVCVCGGGGVDWWPSQDLVQFYNHSDFRAKFLKE